PQGIARRAFSRGLSRDRRSRAIGVLAPALRGRSRHPIRRGSLRHRVAARGLHARAPGPIVDRRISAMVIAATDLERLMAAALARSGATAAMAAATARALAFAELDGIASHGASRIPQYCGHLRTGRANGAAVPAIARDSKA